MTRSEFDFERLSAALDGRLNTEEQATLDADLAVDKALRSDWEDMQSTVRLLNSMPAIQPPRSFTLDPAVYGKSRRSWIFPWTRWAAVLGAMVLMAVVGTAWLNNTTGTNSEGPLAMNSQPATEQFDSSAAGSAPEDMLAQQSMPTVDGRASTTSGNQYQMPALEATQQIQGTIQPVASPSSDPNATSVAAAPPTQGQAAVVPTDVAGITLPTQVQPQPSQPTQPLPPPTEVVVVPEATATVLIPATQAPPIEPAPTQLATEIAPTQAAATAIAETEDPAATIQVTTLPDVEQTPEIAIGTTDETVVIFNNETTMEAYRTLKGNPVSPYTDASLNDRFFRLVWFGYDLITAGTNVFTQNQVQP